MATAFIQYRSICVYKLWNSDTCIEIILNYSNTWTISTWDYKSNFHFIKWALNFPFFLARWHFIFFVEHFILIKSYEIWRQIKLQHEEVRTNRSLWLRRVLFYCVSPSSREERFIFSFPQVPITADSAFVK